MGIAKVVIHLFDNSSIDRVREFDATVAIDDKLEE